MVGKDLINKTFTNILNKHSRFLYNIEDTLHQITDSKEEYKTLHDDIWHFWKQTKNIDHEELIVKGTDGTFFENKNGDDHSVNYTDEMIEFINNANTQIGNEKVLYSFHNHPSGCCFPSVQDMIGQTIVLEKYKVIFSNDGLFICKNTGLGVKTQDVIDAYMMVDKKQMTDFSNRHSRDVHELEEEYPEWFLDGSEDKQHYQEEHSNLFRQSVSEGIDGYVDLFNKKLHTKKRNIKWDCYYVSRKRNND